MEKEGPYAVMKRNLIIAGVVILIFAISICLSHRQAVRQQRRPEVRTRHILIMTDRNDPVKTAQALERIKGIHERIVAGEDFAALAKQYSEDAMTARLGGDLGFVETDAFEKQYGEALLFLEKGEVSDVVETVYGYHIIQLIDRRGPVGEQ
jgi:parvulin-like peptidyl-prolyl isomerase